jgi:hypothetical protein
MLTAVAALVTAVGGLLIAMHQVGLIGGRPPRDPLAADAAAADARPASKTAGDAADGAAASAGAPSAPGAPAPTITPATAEVRVGEYRYRILDTRVERAQDDSLELRLRVRLTNESRYPVNFWDDSFRLVADGVPLAPVGGLNLAVDGEAAKEGTVRFVFPASARELALRVSAYDMRGTVPLAIAR